MAHIELSNFVLTTALAGEIRGLLESHPDLTLNTGPLPGGRSAFHMACAMNNLSAVEVFLSHVPRVPLDLNFPDHRGFTPVMYCCQFALSPIAKDVHDFPRTSRRLIFHPAVRLDVVTEVLGRTWTPLHVACKSFEAMKWMIITGKPLSFRAAPAPAFDDENGIACRVLWERLLRNEDLVRYHLRLEAVHSPCDVVRQAAGDLRYLELFATIVFLSDGLLRERSTTPAARELVGPYWVVVNQQYRRFFAMTQKLPLELQALLCLRAGGQYGTVITTPEAEIALQHLAALLWCKS